MTAKALQGIKVLELGDFIAAPYCGRLLADLGADVIKVEAPDRGDSSRRYGPFQGDRPDPERSGLFLWLNANKRSVTLDARQPKGRELLDQLLSDCDVLVHDLQPKDARDQRLEHGDLDSRYPRLIVAALTRFGHSGAYKDYRAYHINACAAGDVSYGIGEPKRTPLTMPLCLGGYETGAGACAAVILALMARRKTGEGQFVDVSESDIWAAHFAGQHMLLLIYEGLSGGRRGKYSGYFSYPSNTLPCKDGHIALISPQIDQWKRFLDLIGNPEWTKNPRYRNRRAMFEEYPEEVDNLIIPWMTQHTKAELHQMFLDRRIPATPIYTVAEIANHPHFRERNTFLAVEHPVAGRVTIPALPFRLSKTPTSVDRPAPTLGQHNTEILARLTSMGDGEIRRQATGRRSGVEETVLPLAGCRVIDFGTAMAGPIVGHLLADFGAEVIKIESHGRIDGLRRGRPLVIQDVAGGDEGKWPDLQPAFHGLNRNKLGVTVNLKDARGLDLVKQLIKVSDVVEDNFSPGVMARLGLDHASLVKIKPDIITISLTACGESGPLRDALTYAPSISAMGGMSALVGYPDEPLLGMTANAFGDANAGIHGVVAVLAALNHRALTGEGQHIEIAETEAVTSLLGEAFLDYFMNGRVAVPQGNRQRGFAPHGNYPCQGDDQWVSIAVGSEDEWRSFCQAIGNPDWVREARFATYEQRWEHQAELDELVASWARERTPGEVTEILQQQGVAAFPVMNVMDQFTDEHFRERNTFIEIVHPVVGVEMIQGVPWKLSKTPGTVRKHAPDLGADNAYVWGEIVGLKPDEIAELAEAKVSW